ncbi:hypothetical protein PMAYCL1PPCAC_07109, partial [Pristionchus mayeri]
QEVSLLLRSGGMPRTAALISNVVFEKDSDRRISTVSTHFSETEATETKTGEIINIIHDANMDGVRHLKDGNKFVRTAWAAVIITFVILALLQISLQIQFYYRNPIATNVEVEYPNNISFPAVAICNNNQFRLTYITGAWLMNRNMAKEDFNSTLNVFERVLLNAWDMDAVSFLKKAAHTKSRMIMGCTWPNGSSCHLSDFKPVWTVTGLCWAINTNQENPFSVSGSGSGHGLRLLLNVESYERIEACSEQFRTNRLPGLKIVIFNQTDVPETSLSGVNVPAGHSMDIPFKMQHRQKLTSSSCIEETDLEKGAVSNFSSPYNIRTCSIRKYLAEIERVCECSFIRLFDQRAISGLPLCTVGDYFKCVGAVIDRVRESGRARKCLPPCETVQFTAWQDMNRLPRNLMPPLIEEGEEEDEGDVEEEDIENEFRTNEVNKDHITCDSNNIWLTDKQVGRIKREAHRAFEKQSRFQEDVRERTKRMIERLRRAVTKVKNQRWGWNSEDLLTPFERLRNGSECFARLASREESIFTQMNRPSRNNEESTTRNIHYLVDSRSFERQPDRFKTIGALKEYYGQRVEDVLREGNYIISTMEKLWSIFDSSSYSSTITADLSRIDRIFELMNQYESGGLQRRVWAEKMESRQMRHFFPEEFMDGWSVPILRDLEKVLLKTISEIESVEWQAVNKSIEGETAGKIGAMLFFSSTDKKKAMEFEKLLLDMYSCASEEVKEESKEMLLQFKRSMRELQSAYNNLFKKELPDYLDLYEFGDKFERENFAMVNIFMHEMHLEHWRQYETYSFWSLACDVGGALGLFVGASLLTIIEMIYLCIKHGICSRKSASDAITWVRHASKRRKTRRGVREVDESLYDEHANEKKRSIWGTPPKITPIPEENDALLSTDDPLTESSSESAVQPLFSSNQERQTIL